jgi:hypothetical protein
MPITYAGITPKCLSEEKVLGKQDFKHFEATLNDKDKQRPIHNLT